MTVELIDLKIKEAKEIGEALLQRGASSIRSTIGRRIMGLEKEKAELEKANQTESAKTND